MFLRSLAAALAVLAIAAQSASAASGDNAGLYVGARTWGTPECGTPHLEVSTPTDYLQKYGTGVFTVEPDAWADDARCVIVINPDTTVHTAAKRCHFIVHEWGHLTGHEHSLNPRSVMFGEDDVTESRLRVGKRWRWEAAGAFRPCAKLTEPGASFG